jgi:hypothetical protein
LLKKSVESANFGKSKEKKSSKSRSREKINENNTIGPPGLAINKPSQ